MKDFPACGPLSFLPMAKASGTQKGVLMAEDRNLVAHTYSAEQAIEIYHRVKDYVVALRKAHDLLTEKYPDLQR